MDETNRIPAAPERSPLDFDEAAAALPPTPAPGLRERARSFLARHNPLYLLSVLLLFLGLFTASSVGEDNTALTTALAFYGVQVVYEALLLAMGIYLAARLVDRRHGLLLLAILLLFACDATFYQVRIASLASIHHMAWVARAVGALVLAFAALKLLLAHRFLGVKARPDVAFFTLGAVAIISFAPQFLYAQVEAAGGGASLFTGHWELYLVWLAAALIQVPLIVANFRVPHFDERRPNPRAGDEARLQALLVLVPFFALPAQIVLNLHADARVANPNIGDLTWCAIPYFVAGLFMATSLARPFVAERFGLARFDFAGLALIAGLAVLTQGNSPILLGAETPRFVTERFGDGWLNPYRLNLLIVLLGHLACGFARRNAACLAFVTLAAAGAAGAPMKRAGEAAFESVRQIPRAAWAGLLLALSFATLGLGFATSLAVRPSEPEAVD